jgi:hypothetical protein
MGVAHVADPALRRKLRRADERSLSNGFRLFSTPPR